MVAKSYLTRLASLRVDKRRVSVANAKILNDRLSLERRLKDVMIPWFMFLIILTCFFVNLLAERPIGEMYKVKTNLKDHFRLESVIDIYKYQDMYEYLYHFMETAERFDPLDRYRYVERAYGPPDATTMDFAPNGTNKTDQVTLTRSKKFYGVSTVVVRPMVMMTRGNRIPCTGFAEQFDMYYALSRYLRYKYKGKTIPGAWQPRRVWFKTAKDDQSPQEISIRKDTSAPYLSEVHSKVDAAKGSKLLMCISPELNNTMRRSLKNKYQNVEIGRKEGTFFGDLLTSKADVLQYMGYVVNPSEVNFTKFPRCVLSDTRNAEGEVIKGGEKVTARTVAKRCERTSERWHDVHTRRILAQVFLYTPVIEVFTRVKVIFNFGQTGLMTNTFEVASWQVLVHTDRYTLWLALTIVQLGLSVLQIALVFAFSHKAKKDDRRYPKVRLFDKKSEGRALFTVVLQILFIIYYMFRLIAEHTGLDCWNVIDELLSTNPYDGTDGMHAAVENLDNLIHFSKQYQIIRCLAFVLVLLSFFQNVMYMNAHPQIALLSNMVVSIFSELFHFTLIFSILYAMLCLVGSWSFGADVATFNSVGDSFAKGFRWAVFGGSLMREDGSLSSNVDKTLLTIWEITFTFVVTVFLMNAFLAIVVAGYTAAYAIVTENEAVRNFVLDIVLMLWTQLHGTVFNWPKRPEVMMAMIDIMENGTNEVDADKLFELGLFTDKNSAEVYIDFYISLVPKMDRSHHANAKAEDDKNKQINGQTQEYDPLWDRRIEEITKAHDRMLKARESALEAGVPSDLLKSAHPIDRGAPGSAVRACPIASPRYDVEFTPRIVGTINESRPSVVQREKPLHWDI